MHEALGVHAGLVDERRRDAQAMLGAGQCEPWMYLPEAATGGHLEEVIGFVQDQVDAACEWGTVKDRDLDHAQSELDGVRDHLAAAPPLDAARVCRGLRQAYRKATVPGGK